MTVDTPFSISPNPNSLYITPLLRSALIKARFTIDKRQGLTCVLGDNGLGKSSFLRFLFAEYGAREDVVATLIPTPSFPSEFAMLKSVCQDFDLPAKRSLVAQQEELQNYLLEKYEAGFNVVLFVDEGQRLTNKMLELVRTLLNFETAKHKLIQIILAGQLELRDRLLSDENKAIKSRIIAASLLASLTPDEMAAMIEHRCKVADITNPFPAPTLERLYDLSGGVPRETLKICALAYEMMLMEGSEEIDVETLDAAYDEGALAA
jgi:general secretion pathway protein A